MTDRMQGQDRINSAEGLNATQFQIMQELLKVQTCIPVIVTSVNAGGLGAVGYVDVQPAVTMITGAGISLDHGVITNLPYNRLQGGGNAIIIDPEVGDIGLACFSSRDISVFKNARKMSPPGSWRNHDMSDGFYIGGFLNATPTQYIQFSSSGITVYSPTKITVEAPSVEVTASDSATVTAPSVSVTGTSSATVTAPSIQLGSDGGTVRELVDSRMIDLFNSHTHTGDSGGTTGTPNQTMASGSQTTTIAKAN